MQIPKYITVLHDGKKTYLSPDADGLKSCYIDVRLNGESKLEFLLPATSPKVSALTPECEIWAGGRVYTLLLDQAIDTTRDENNKLWTKVMAVERWSELGNEFPEPYISNDPTTPTPADLAVIIVAGGSDLSGGQYSVGSAAHALYAVLDGSDWTLGTVDVPGIHDIEMEKVSRLSLIKEIQNKWGGYLVWDSENKVVHLRDGNTWQNYNGFQIRYAKNLKHITRTQSNRIVTKLYAFGHDDLDIASVNDGKKYLTNFSYIDREYTAIYKNQDIYDPQELKDKAEAELALACRPRHLYKVKIADLRTLPEYEHEDFALGDMADVIDPAAAPDSPRPRIIRHKYNLFLPWDCEIELGDPEERLMEQLKAAFGTSEFVGSIFNSSGKMSGMVIEDLSIYAEKIANLSIDATKIVDLSITADKIENGTITGSKIADLTITGSKIASGTITGSKIDSLTITSSNIANLTITGSKIANATITDAKITDLSADKITAGTITASIAIHGPYIFGGHYYGPDANDAYLEVGMNGTLADLSLYRGGIGQDDYPAFRIYDQMQSIALQTGIEMFGGATNSETFLEAYYDDHVDDEVKAKVYGKWDFSNAKIKVYKWTSQTYHTGFTGRFTTSSGYIDVAQGIVIGMG